MKTHRHHEDHVSRDHQAKRVPEHGHASRHHGKHSLANDRVITDGLQAIYGDDVSDLQIVKRDGSRLTQLLTRIVVSLALLAMVAFGGFFVYVNVFDNSGSKMPLVMSIEAPLEAKSGEAMRIVVNYANPTGTPLAALELDINLPSSFALVVAQPVPTDAEAMLWNIGSLGSHSDGQIILEGVWLSAVPATTTIQALAAYRPGNFNSNFSEIATSTVTTLSSVISLELTGPEAGIPGQDISYTAKIKNTGLQDIAMAKFDLTLPAGFILSSSTPALEAGADPEWILSNLVPDVEQIITWNGSFTTEVKDVQQFMGVVAISEGDRDLAQATETWFTDVAGSDLQATLVVNGNTDQATIEPGETIRLTVRLENVGTTDLSGASYLLDFKPDAGIPIVWNSAILSGGKLTPQGVVFDATTLGTLKAGEKKTYNLSFPVKDVPATNEVDTWTASVYVTVGNNTVQTSPFKISLKAKAELSSTARYYSDTGAPLGEGPLPPEVGSATSYRIFWNLKQTVHELDNITVTATIPPDVVWTNRVLNSTGSLQHDAVNQTVRWEIAHLPVATAATAEFSLQLVPGAEDVGTFVKLLSGAILSATDVKTGTLIETVTASVTTELPDDALAAGRGTVVD